MIRKRKAELYGAAALLAPLLLSNAAFWLLAPLTFFFVPSGSRKSFSWVLPFGGFLLCAILARSIIIDFDALRALSSLVHDIPTGISALHASRYLMPFSLRDWYEVCIVLWFGILAVIVQQDRDCALRFKEGLKIGILLCTAVVLYQKLFPTTVAFPNYTLFWKSVYRVPGTLSDPNALGIVAFLLFGIFLPDYAAYRRRYDLVVLIATLVCGVLSGSRSFFLGIAVMLVCLCAYYSRKLSISALVVILGMVFVINSFPIGVFSSWVPIGMNRVLQSMHLDSISQMFFSREIFFTAAFSLWKDAPALGVGFNRFEYFFPYFNALLGSDVGWIDNANNYFLGLLAEIGLLGGTFFLISFSRLRFKNDDSLEARILYATIFAFIATLFFGPHLDFMEVSFVAALIVGSATVVRMCSDDRARLAGRDSVEPQIRSSSTESRPAWVVGCILFTTVCTALAVQALSFEYGLYNYEGAVQWFQPKSQFKLRCNEKQSATLTIQAPLAAYGNKPLTIELHTSTGVKKTMTFNSGEAQRAVFMCSDEIMVQLRCSRFWIPALQNLGADTRTLCGQVRHDT